MASTKPLGPPFILPGWRIDWRCSECNRTKGDHKLGTLNCPMTRHKFTAFHLYQSYYPQEKGPMKEFTCTVDGVPVIGKASEMHDGNYWAIVSVTGGLTYGFVMMRHGVTKTPKYKCTQAIRVAPRTGQMIKGETPVEVLGYVGPIEKVFEHVVETLVEFSKDDDNVNEETKAARLRANQGEHGVPAQRRGTGGGVRPTKRRV